MNTRVKNDIIAHAAAIPGEEVCGFIYQDEAGVHAYPCVNISPDDKAVSFEIHPDDYIAVRQKGRIWGIYHGGHTHRNESFSEEDLSTAREMGLPLYLYSASGKWSQYIPPSFVIDPVGIPWCWGMADCYETVRIYYRQKRAVYMTDYDRDESFQNAKESQIVPLIEKEHFRYVDTTKESVQIDDVLLFRTPGCAYPHHLVVVCGPNRILHHPRNQISRIDDLDDKWLKRLVAVLRYNPSVV